MSGRHPGSRRVLGARATDTSSANRYGVRCSFGQVGGGTLTPTEQAVVRALVSAIVAELRRDEEHQDAEAESGPEAA